MLKLELQKCCIEAVAIKVEMAEREDWARQIEAEPEGFFEGGVNVGDCDVDARVRSVTDGGMRVILFSERGHEDITY